MRTRLSVLVLLLVTMLAAGVVAAPTARAVLVFDRSDGLHNFRTTDDAYPSRPKTPSRGKADVLLPSREGLGTVKASGSAQFGAAGLQELKARLDHRDVVVVDLRQESHGFIGGQPVTWYGRHNHANLGRSPSLVEADEAARLNDAFTQGTVTVATTKPDEAGGDAHLEAAHLKDAPPQGTVAAATAKRNEEDAQHSTKGAGNAGTRDATKTVAVTSVSTEADLVTEAGLRYVRIPVPDHLRPEPVAVDRFVTLVKSLPPTTWMHFHCRAGVGRTTTFMAMLDMMRNARDVSLEDILRRQCRIGGADLAAIPSTVSWKHGPAANRLQFLKQFHEYCRVVGPGFSTPFTTWGNTHSR